MVKFSKIQGNFVAQDKKFGGRVPLEHRRQ